MENNEFEYTSAPTMEVGTQTDALVLDTTTQTDEIWIDTSFRDTQTQTDDQSSDYVYETSSDVMSADYEAGDEKSPQESEILSKWTDNFTRYRDYFFKAFSNFSSELTKFPNPNLSRYKPLEIPASMDFLGININESLNFFTRQRYRDTAFCSARLNSMLNNVSDCPSPDFMAAVLRYSANLAAGMLRFNNGMIWLLGIFKDENLRGSGVTLFLHEGLVQSQFDNRKAELILEKAEKMVVNAYEVLDQNQIRSPRRNFTG